MRPVTETSPDAEYFTPDNMEMLVQEAELYINMTEADIVAHAAAVEMTVDDYRRWREKKIVDYRQVDPDSLTRDQYRRLFGQDPDLDPPPDDDEVAAELGMSRTEYDELMAEAKALGIFRDE
jgi:hypothetical protein